MEELGHAWCHRTATTSDDDDTFTLPLLVVFSLPDLCHFLESTRAISISSSALKSRSVLCRQTHARSHEQISNFMWRKYYQITADISGVPHEYHDQHGGSGLVLSPERGRGPGVPFMIALVSHLSPFRSLHITSFC
jgi:hypothetical protein